MSETPALPATTNPVPLDLPSETIFAWEQEGFPQTDYASFSMRGPCDAQALREALWQCQDQRPFFHANLIPTRIGLWQVLAWHERDARVELEVRDFTGLEAVPEDMESWIHGQMAGEIDHVLDLRANFPVRFILYRLPREHHVLVFFFHHVAIDGGGMYDFLREVFRVYHRAVEGAQPEWADAAGIHSQSGGAGAVSAISTWRALGRALAEGRRYPMHRAVQIAGESSDLRGRNMVRHIVEDPDLQRALRDRARRDGGSITDLFLAASKLAIEQWNLSRNALAGIMYHGLAVNQRLRQDRARTKAQGNPMSGISIPSDPADRRDPEALLRHVIERRKELIEQGFDIALSRIVHGIQRAGRVIPLSARYRWLRVILDAKSTFFVTNVGVVWPRIEGGRPTGETLIRRVGQMELLDVHASVGSTKNNFAALILRTFLGRLYVVLSLGRHRISDEDAKEFSKLVFDKAMDYL